MANFYDEPEDELLDEETSPYSSISNAPPSQPIRPSVGSPQPFNPAIKLAMEKSRAQAGEGVEDIGAYREAKRGADYIGNMGLAFSQALKGGGTPTGNDALYQGLQKQNEGMLKSVEDERDRAAKVKAAIEARKFQEQRLASAEEDRKIRREELSVYRGQMRGDKQAAIEEKRNNHELSLNVPGYERTGEVLPKPEEAAKLRKATANAEQLDQKLNRLADLVDEHGSFEFFGKSGAEMASLATEIQLLSKGEEMYQLGVLTGPDKALLEKITADPDGFKSLFTQDGTRKAQIMAQLSSIQSKLQSSAKSMGYRKSGGESPNYSVGDPNNAMAAPSAGPKVGTEEGGFVFLGGNPKDPHQWAKVSK